MISTITVVSTVSRREGQLTFAVSARTCRTNSPGETFAILFGRPACSNTQKTNKTNPSRASPPGDRRLDLHVFSHPIRPLLRRPQERRDRKRVVTGRGEYVSVDFGGRRGSNNNKSLRSTKI